jgi:RimJ/RimL family protein N-acetyltransferase
MDVTITTHRGNVTLRPARESDAGSYRDLRLEALRNHPEAFSSDHAINEAQPPSYWKGRLRELRDDNGMIFFAIHEDRFIGMCGIYRGSSPKTRHSATIVGVYLQPGWRGLGIAEALVNACLAWGRAHEVTIAKLGVAMNNKAAIRCYARCGFTAYGVEPSALLYDGVMYDELWMAKLI